MKHSHISFFVIFALLFGMVGNLQARSEAQLKARMAERLPQIVALKQNGSVGENNKGLLSARKNLSGKNATRMAAENSDRREVYELIAGRANTSAANVAKARAANIRKSAPQGTWVQLLNGTWKKA